MSEGNDLAQRNRRVVRNLLIGAVAMFGFAFAMVPLYEVLCEVTGLNGKTNSTAAELRDMEQDSDRVITVQFVTRAGQGMPWDFRPEVRSIKVHPGEIAQVNFQVKNPTDNTIIGQAIPSVSPGLAAPHLLKTQCFCFDNQTLAAGGEADMPMIFYLDPALPKHITTITLSYTMFDVTERVAGNDNTLAAR
jgi:cytochrome c oxidase assembly protein subunit 11